jgi:uncharacterized repeat protein (TIGR03803 family)
MQFIRHSRRFAVLVSLALAGLAAAPAWALRTQDANVVPVASLALLGGADSPDAPAQVRGNLLLASDNNIYFASYGGGDGTGAIGKITPTGELTTLYAFEEDGSEGVSAFGGLIQASDGHLYGTTYLGGEEGGGTLFRVTLDGTFSVVHSFGGGDPNALLPYTGVTQGPDGLLYGTTRRGGNNNTGVVYRVATDGSGYTVLHHFVTSSGAEPQGALVVGPDNLLYGTTMTGGANDRGTIYRITASGTHELLYSFPKLGAVSVYGQGTNSVGANPRAGLMLSTIDGNFYGTAYQGGTNGLGTVFRFTPGGTLTALHHFAGPTTGGSSPLASVIQDASGNLYGTTETGGALHAGTAWRLAPDGAFSLLHGFIGAATDGHTPYAALLAAHGSLYGATFYEGGSQGAGFHGAIFKLDVGSGGVLPIDLQISAQEITAGATATLTWSAPAGYTCKRLHGNSDWTNDNSPATGSLVLQPGPGPYAFGLSCVEPDDGNTATPQVTRIAFASLLVSAPLLDPVDGGGGAGSLSLWWLLLAAALLYMKVIKETRAPCP